MNEEVAITSLAAGLDEVSRLEFERWWAGLSTADRDALAELTRMTDARPWRQCPEAADDGPQDDLVNDWYEYLVNHEMKASVPFWGTFSRDGRRGSFTRCILAIPLWDPDWPPYSEALHYNAWKARGKLADADLGFA